MQKKWKSLLVLLFLNLIYTVSFHFISNRFSWIVTIMYVMLLFIFGNSLNNLKKKKNTWFSKLIISLFVICIVFARLNWIIVPKNNNFFELLLKDPLLDLLIIYSGWVFFQV